MTEDDLKKIIDDITGVLKNKILPEVAELDTRDKIKKELYRRGEENSFVYCLLAKMYGADGDYSKAEELYNLHLKLEFEKFVDANDRGAQGEADCVTGLRIPNILKEMAKLGQKFDVNIIEQYIFERKRFLYFRRSTDEFIEKDCNNEYQTLVNEIEEIRNNKKY